MVKFLSAKGATTFIGETFARTLLSQQRKSWQVIKERCNQQKGRRELFLDQLGPVLHRSATLLDAGCGKGRGTPADYRKYVRSAVGLDLSLEDLQQNSTVHSWVQGDVQLFPFRDRVFDIVVSQWCIEHLKHPGLFFSEMSRILKPSGHFVFCTPNMYNYITCLSRITPLSIHKFFNKLLLHIDESDTFPTFYRANTVAKLDKYLGQCGLVRRGITMYEEPPWLWTFSPSLCRLALRYREVIMRSQRLNMFCGIIFAVYQKEN